MQTEKLTWLCDGMSIELAAETRAASFVVARAELDFDAA
jgi:hypothetical protein